MSPSSATPPAIPFPETGRLLGVDYGTKRVGLAISTPDQRIASPLEIRVRQNDVQDERYFRGILADYSVQGVVVGLPIHVNGNEGQKAREARAYGQWIEKHFSLPVTFWDERYTSSVAEDFMIGLDLTREQRKKRIDMLAAQIMLQSYLDRPR